MDRRRFLQAGAFGAGAVVLGRTTTACAPTGPAPNTAFVQGVASGLHSADAVVLWTRVEPAVSPVDRVMWQVSATPDMSAVVASGEAPVLAATDHTVKVLVEGLDPNRSWWYRFVADGEPSPVGRARTLPAPGDDIESLRLGFGSCQSYATGYYTAWRDAAARDLDAIVFLGDFIYESPSIQLLRPLRSEPLFETNSLDTYRAKYRHYRSDRDLRAASAAHPWSVVWDDHELHNDWDRTVYAEEPGRFEAASRAWFEYQPVWPTDRTSIHRSFRWGSLAELFVIDSRQYRDPAVPSIFGGGLLGPDAADPNRSMLGAAQRDWFLDGLGAAHGDGVTWKVVGNPQPIGPMRILDLDTPELRAAIPGLARHAGVYFGLEGWDGFPAERDRILDHLRTDAIGGTTFLSGDVHAFYAGALRADYDDDSSPIVAHDFAGGSVASPAGGPHTAILESGGTMSPAWDFADGTRNGYGVIECTPDAATVTFVGVDATVPWGGAKPIYTRTLPAT